MPFLPLILALVAMTPAPPSTDSAGNRLETFAARPDPTGDDALHCTPDRRWCAQISRDADSGASTLDVFAGEPGGGPPLLTRALDKTEDENLGLWPRAIRLAGPGEAVMIGVEHRTSTSYSGGGGGATTLELIRLAASAPGAARTVLSIPLSASLLIRACFDEKDQYRRRGACHDEYSFGTDVNLAPRTPDGTPRLVITTEATTFPAGSSRDGDSTTRGRLSPRDLVRARDPRCSYRRVMTLDPATGLYAPDTPLPDCEAYTVP